MNDYRFVPVLLIFLSPLLYILSGCGRLDAPKPQASAEPQWVITKVGNPPVVAPVAVKSPECRCENCDCVDCQCKFVPVTYDPNRVPTEDDPYVKPSRVTLPKSNPPLTNAEELCTDGSCAVQGGSGGERRGLFGRWRR